MVKKRSGRSSVSIRNLGFLKLPLYEDLLYFRRTIL